MARPDAAEVLARELENRRYRVAPIAIGTNTDPYQPIEKTWQITRQCLQVLAAFNHPVAIVTKGTLVERDLDILTPLAAKGLVRLMTSPIVPGLTDHEIEALLLAGRDAGADAASWIMLRLPREVSGIWQEWLAEHEPGRAGRIMSRLREMHGGKDYDARWGRRMRGEGHHAEIVALRFRAAARRLGLDRETAALRCDLFAVPPKPGDQLSFF